MKGFILILIALLLFIILAPIGILWQSIRHLAGIGNYFFKIAISIDQAGNVICSKLFNDIFIKKEGHRFGDEDETISSVLGKNKITETLTMIGKVIAYLLNKIEKDHIENAVENN